MSNTDGEDTLENRIWKAVQSQPNFSSVSTDYINHWRSFLDQELASLRKQLADTKAKKLLFDRIKQTEIEVLKEELKQKEDENRELVESLRKYEGREYDFRCTAPWKISDSENTWTECYNWLHSRVEVIEISVRSYVCRFLKNDVMWKLYVPYKDTKLQTVILNELSGEWLEIKNANEMKIAFKKLNLSA